MAHERLRTTTPLTPIPRSCLTYPLKRAGQDLPALSPEPVTLKRLPLGQSPFLHRLLSLSARPRSAASQVLWDCPTSRARASSVCVLGLSDAVCDFSLTDRHGISRFPLKVLACMLRVSDRAGSKSVSRYATPPVLPSDLVRQRRHPEVATACAMVVQFRGSIPGLHVPLSTLHLRPCGRRCMTRSQCGSLALHCMKLSFTTPCRL